MKPLRYNFNFRSGFNFPAGRLISLNVKVKLPVKYMINGQIYCPIWDTEHKIIWDIKNSLWVALALKGDK